MRVARIHVYPVKSLAGQAVDAAEVEPWGLRHDRRWMVLEPDGSVLTASAEHRLLGLSADVIPDGIELRSRDGERLAVPTPIGGEVVPTSLPRLESVRLASDDAHRWLSRLLDRPVRLAWLDDPRRRNVSAAHGGMEGDTLSLADAGPLHVTSAASLRQLNDWMIGDALTRGDEPPQAIAMARFRPNVVIDNVPEAFDEDSWRRVRIGAIDFRFADHCDRCVMTTLDPQSLLGGKEPLRTLAAHRQWNHKSWFGVRVIPASVGVIRAGDAVEVLTRAPG